MERLTKRLGSKGTVVFTQGKYEETIPAEMTNDDIRAVLKKLADYEYLEEQGLLVRLPCPIGTTVWDICGMDIRENVLSGIECGKDGKQFLWANDDEWIGELNDLVFLTREEAEKKLKEMKDRNWIGVKKMAYNIGKSIIAKSIKHYGKEIQSTVCMEECAELIQAISKAKRGKLDKENMMEEIADVLICIEMLKQIYDIPDHFIEDWIKRKQERMLRRMEARV